MKNLTELNHAIDYATIMHRNSQTSTGEPFKEYLTRLMNRMTTDEEKITMVLHDILSVATIDNLHHVAIPPRCRDAIIRLTRSKDLTFPEWINTLLNPNCLLEINVAIEILKEKNPQTYSKDIIKLMKYKIKLHTEEYLNQVLYLIEDEDFISKASKSIQGTQEIL